MPLPQDERIVALANDLLQQFHAIFGLHPGFRPAHAKGPDAHRDVYAGRGSPPSPKLRTSRGPPRRSPPASPTRPVFRRCRTMCPTPIRAGFAIRFNLAEHVHTDIVAHSTDGFPTHDGTEFLEFLKAAAASGPDVPSPKPVEKFLGSHPAALGLCAGAQAVSFQLRPRHLLRRHRLRIHQCRRRDEFGRYRIVPEQGNDFLTDERSPPRAPTTTSTRSPSGSPRPHSLQDDGADCRPRGYRR